jgi:hypothetical protein
VEVVNVASTMYDVIQIAKTVIDTLDELFYANKHSIFIINVKKTKRCPKLFFWSCHDDVATSSIVNNIYSYVVRINSFKKEQMGNCRAINRRQFVVVKMLHEIRRGRYSLSILI